MTRARAESAGELAYLQSSPRFDLLCRLFGLAVALLFFCHPLAIDTSQLWSLVLALPLSPKWTFTLGSFLVHELVFVVLSLVMAAIDHGGTRGAVERRRKVG